MRGGNGLIILAVVGGGAFWAYKKGMLPQQVTDAVDDFAGFVRPPASFLPEADWGRGAVERAERSAAVNEASGGRIVPILGASEVVTVNKYEAMLRRNFNDVSTWAKRNIGWAAAIASVENSGMNPSISGDNGTSHGVYQVKVATAETCARAGYQKYAPTKANLKTYEGGVYFGTAEMERLSKINADHDWIIQAYNGGAGFQQMPAKYQRDRAAYLQRVKRAYVKLYGGKVA